MSDDVVINESAPTDELFVEADGTDQLLDQDALTYVALVDSSPTDVITVEDIVNDLQVEQIGTRGPEGPAGPSGDGPQVTLFAIAAVNLSGERIVTSQADGTLVYADNDDVADLDRPLWLTMAAALAGTEVQLLAFGPFTEPTWNWTPGVAIFLGSNGTLTQVTPTAPSAAFVVQVALPSTPTTLFYDARSPIALAS